MRRRLSVVALATTAMVAIAFVVPLGSAVRSMARERALSQAREVTQVLVPPLALGDARTTQVALASATSRAPGRVTAITHDGRVIGAPTGDDPGLVRARDGEAFIGPADEGVYVYTPVLTGDPSRTAVVRVHVPRAALVRGVGTSWAILAALGAALVVAAVVVADRLGRSTVTATGDVAATARRLSSGDLDARAPTEGPPEVADVAIALNGLAEQINHLLAAEREAAADLSHRLRTPLTALRVDIGELEDTDVAGHLAASLDGLERQIDRVIRETRRPADRRRDRLDLAELVVERTRFWAPLAEDQHRRWEVEVYGPAPVDVDGEAMAAALDALLGNVFAHTPDGVGCRVEVTADDDRVRLVIEDAGPGFVEERLPERGVSGAGSTGLGLDNARRTTEAAGGVLRIGRSALGGARVVVDLPRA